MKRNRIILKFFPVITGLVVTTLLISVSCNAQNKKFDLYPVKYEFLPETKSPTIIYDTIEAILVITKDNRYSLVDVTVEDGEPLLYSYKLGTFMGKDMQLHVDKGDFPEMAATGLHSESRLDNLEFITGIPVSVINCTGKPQGYSAAGFMADDEDLVSVLKNDNRTVSRLGLTHAMMAKPLFHVWNLILKEYELGNWARYYDNINQIIYNGKTLNFNASGSKGWQISIFFDEIHGRHNIHIDRDLTGREKTYLKEKYSHLAPEEMKNLIECLTNIDFSEMLPYYIMRYGFYEGHTSYRTDPIAIALIFGLRSLESIDIDTGGKLYNNLFDHFTLEHTSK